MSPHELQTVCRCGRPLEGYETTVCKFCMNGPNTDLFGQPITEPKPVHHHGHPTRPGTGPKGETCGTCQHRVHAVIGSGKKYQKCRLIRANWSHGPGTDIKKKDAACALWEGKKT